MSMELHKALGETTKRTILLQLIEKRTLCACQIPLLIGKSQNNTSMQLKLLKKWNLVSSKQEGKKQIYKVSNPLVNKVLKATGEIK